MHVSCSCSHFPTPRQLPFPVRADPGWAQAGAQECVFPMCVRTPARPRARARAHARPRAPRARARGLFAVNGERGGSVSSSLSDSLLGEQHPNISKICWDAESSFTVQIWPDSQKTLWFKKAFLVQKYHLCSKMAHLTHFGPF